MLKRFVSVLATVVCCYSGVGTLNAAEPTSDIPRSIDVFQNSQGAWFHGAANHNIAYVNVGPNEQKVWFGVDASDPQPAIYYNRRYRSFQTGWNWTWDYLFSPKVVDTGIPGGTQLGDVLYDATAPFKYGLRNYAYVMYLIDQPFNCGAASGLLGLMKVAFSNDGIAWTAPTLANYSPAVQYQCSDGITRSGIAIEAVGAVYDATTKLILLVELDGEIAELIDPANMSLTKTGFAYASASNPTLVTHLGDISNIGLFNPRLPGANTNLEQFEPYHYFIDLGIAYDDVTGAFYVGRAYPYPFDRNWTQPHTPCGTSGCLTPPAQLQNRVQIYRATIGSLANFSSLSAVTWQLVLDFGSGFGYRNDAYGSCDLTSLVSGQADVGHDMGAVSFFKTPTGRLVREAGLAYALGGSLFRTKANDTCLTTGNEREYVHSFVP